MTSIVRTGRRHFLLGAGGGLLSIPFLGSLESKRARAQSAPQLRLVVLGTDHGGVWPENMYPAQGSVETRRLYDATGEVPAHDVRWSALQLSSEGGRAWLSRVLEADAGRLTPSVVGKMNVLGGVDISTYIGHNRACFTGNFGANDQGRSLHGVQVATVDQVVADHEPFHRSPFRQRSMNFGIRYGVSSNLRHSASARRVNGTVAPVQATDNPEVLWRALFEGAAGGDEPAGVPVVDHVMEHYRRLTRGAFGEARRLSRSDRERLESHMTLLSEVQQRVASLVECGSVAEPRPDWDDDVDLLRHAVDLFAAAIRCGASNVGVITAAGARVTNDGGWNNWHEQVAHNGGGDRASPSFNPEFQRINWRAHRRFFEEVFLRLVEGLDVEEESGQTYLDRSLVYWAMESGDRTHTNFSVPIVTAGAAGGFFETGRYVDFRNRANDRLVSESDPERYPGILMNRFLGNVLQSVGVPPDVYHRELQTVQPEAYANGTRGYGVREYHPHNFWRRVDLERQIWPSHHFEDGDGLLPGWVRGA
jgi:hypothetical protein